MSGGKKANVAGYYYFLGSHLIACHGPVDFLSHILSDDKVAWQGISSGGPIVFFNVSLYGGDEKEGGLAGRYDLEMGGPSQGQNPYLALKLAPNPVPAYRGVVGLVGWGNYVGTTTYLKKMGLRLSRIHVRTTDGLPQWYDEKAQIGNIWAYPQAFRIALETTTAMDEMTGNGHTKLENAKQICSDFIDYLIGQKNNYPAIQLDVEFSNWGSTHEVTTLRNASSADLTALKTTIASKDSTGQVGSDFREGAASAPAFFAGSPAGAVFTDIFLSQGRPDVDGQPGTTNAQLAGATLLNIVGIKSYCFVIDGDPMLDNTLYLQYLDNTFADLIPNLVAGASLQVISIVQNVQMGQMDMNPAHIIRECLTDPDWGMGYQEADVDDASFSAAADRLFDERMGMSLLWNKQITIEDFIKQITKHIDATLYIDRTTGLFTLKLIRLDYDESSILLLDPSNVARVSDFTRPTFGELTNSVTVQYWDSGVYKDGSVTVQDIALTQMQNGTINTTVEYPGFTNLDLASRAAQRDLRTLSTPIVSCTVYANRDASELNIGDVFRLTWPDYGLNQLVMRVVSIAYGDGKSNQVRITATQDVYNLPDAGVIAPEAPYIPPSILPVPTVDQMVYEVPYLEAVQQSTQLEVDTILADNIHVGYIGAAAGRPSTPAINAQMQIDAGAGYAFGSDLNFCPTATLVASIDRMAEEFSIANVKELTNGLGQTNIPTGSWFQIDEEIMSLVSLVGNVMTVKRGVLDTVPALHSANAVIYFWDTLSTRDTDQYDEGETLNVKLLPRTFSGVLPLAYATPMAKEMQARMYRPYPPGDFKVDGAYFPTAPVLTDLALTWVSRNRLQQTGDDLIGFKDPTIAAETGTTYRVKVVNPADETELYNETTADLNHTVPFTSMSGWPSPSQLRLSSIRDGYDSYQFHHWDFGFGSVSVPRIRVQMAEISPSGTGIPESYLPWYVNGVIQDTPNTNSIPTDAEIVTAPATNTVALIAYAVDADGDPLPAVDQPALTIVNSDDVDYTFQALDPATLASIGFDTVPAGGYFISATGNLPTEGSGNIDTSITISASGYADWVGNVSQPYTNLDVFLRWTLPGESPTISDPASYEFGITESVSGVAFNNRGYSDRYMARDERVVIRGKKTIRTGANTMDIKIPISAYCEAPPDWEIALEEAGPYGASARYELTLQFNNDFPVDSSFTLGNETASFVKLLHGGVDQEAGGYADTVFWIRRIGETTAIESHQGFKYFTEGSFPVNDGLTWNAVLDDILVIDSGDITGTVDGYVNDDANSADPPPYHFHDASSSYTLDMTTTYSGAGGPLYSGGGTYANLGAFQSWASTPPEPFTPGYSATGTTANGDISIEVSATGDFSLLSLGGSTSIAGYSGSEAWGLFCYVYSAIPTPTGTITFTYSNKESESNPCGAGGSSCLEGGSGTATTATRTGYRYSRAESSCITSTDDVVCAINAFSDDLGNPATIKRIIIPGVARGKARTNKP
jgi:hypothetical protein